MRDLIRFRRWVLGLFPVAGLTTAVLTDTLAVVLLLGTAYTAAHVVTIPDRTGRRLSLSPMVAIAALLLTHGAVLPNLAGAALGLPIGWWIVRTMRGPRSLDLLFPAEPIALTVAVLLFARLHVLFAQTGRSADLGHAVTVGVAAAAWYSVAALIRVLADRARRHTAAPVIWRQVLRDGPAYAALFSSGAMIGFAWDALSWWSIPLAGLPYAFSHLSLHRVAAAVRTYRQTITALGRIPEAGGLVGHGRAERTGRLAAEVAGEVRLPPAEVERVEYAGLLHDVGRVVFSDPTIAAGGYRDEDVASWGAAIIRESPYLARVGQVVADQYKPYRRPGEARNDLVPRSAQVVRVCAAYDRTVHEAGRTVTEALEELHRGAAYDYDPEVVAALREVLQRRGVAGA